MHDTYSPGPSDKIQVYSDHRVAVRLKKRYLAACSDHESEPLSGAEQARFAECHQAVLDYQLAALKASYALREIRDSKLFRGNFRTFDGYCRWVWDWRRTYANDFIAFGEIVNALATVLDKVPGPVCEAQTRPLRQVLVDDRAEVWKMALQIGGTDMPMQETVMVARQEFWRANPDRRPDFTKGSSRAPQKNKKTLKAKLRLDSSTVAFLRQHAKDEGVSFDRLITILIERSIKKIRQKTKMGAKAQVVEPGLFVASAPENNLNS